MPVSEINQFSAEPHVGAASMVLVSRGKYEKSGTSKSEVGTGG
jgi:hypothetical protein